MFLLLCLVGKKLCKTIDFNNPKGKPHVYAAVSGCEETVSCCEKALKTLRRCHCSEEKLCGGLIEYLECKDHQNKLQATLV